MTSENEQGDVISCREPSAQNLELVQWAEEAVRSDLATLKDSLRQMVTLTTALLAGSAAFLAQLPMPPWVKVIGAACLLISLSAALWGSLPIESHVDISQPAAIQRARNGAAFTRTLCLWVSSSFLFAAFLVLLIGIIVQSFH